MRYHLIVLLSGDLQIRVRFGVVDNLAEPIIIGTWYIDCLIKYILPTKGLTVPLQSRSFVVASAYAPAVKSMKTVQSTENTPQLSYFSYTLFQGAKQVFIQPNIDMVVRVGPLQASNHYLSPQPSSLTCRLVLPGSGVVNRVH